MLLAQQISEWVPEAVLSSVQVAFTVERCQGSGHRSLSQVRKWQLYRAASP